MDLCGSEDLLMMINGCFQRIFTWPALVLLMLTA